MRRARRVGGARVDDRRCGVHARAAGRRFAGRAALSARCGTCHPPARAACAHRGDVGDPGGADARDDAAARRAAAHRRRASNAARVSEGARDRRRRSSHEGPSQRHAARAPRRRPRRAGGGERQAHAPPRAEDRRTRRSSGRSSGALHGRRGTSTLAAHAPDAATGRSRSSASGRVRRRHVADAYRRAGDQTIARAREARARSVAVAFLAEPTRLPVERPEAFGAFVEGCAAHRLRLHRLQSRPRPGRDRDASRSPALVAPRDAGLRRAVRTGEILADATNQARTWINEPAAVMTPAAFAADAERVLANAGLEVRVDGPAAIRRARHGRAARRGARQRRGAALHPRHLSSGRRAPRPATAGRWRPRAAPHRARRQGHHVRQRRPLAEAPRRHGAHEARHGGRRGGARRDARDRGAPAGGRGPGLRAREREHAGRLGDQAGRHRAHARRARPSRC